MSIHNDAGAADVTLKRNPSLVNLIYEKLEDLILSGELPSGAAVNERALSLQMAVSRAPIREACRRLEQAGLVSIIDNRGVFVREISRKSASEIYHIASLLRADSAASTISTVDDAAIARLHAMLQQMEQDATSGDIIAYYRHNDDFHVALVALGGNERRTELYRSLNNELTLYRQRALRNSPDFERSLAAHRQIVDALARRDLAGYRDAMEEHSEQATLRLMSKGV